METQPVLSAPSSYTGLRILHVIGWLDFADGGPPMVATRLAAAQAHLGHAVSMASYSSGAVDKETDKRLAGLPWWDRVTLHRFPAGSRWERLTGRDAGHRLTPLINGVDVVHLHNVWEGILLQGAKVAQAANKPYLIVVNGMLDPWALTQKGLKKKFALAVTHRGMLNQCAMLHLLNEDERRLIEPLGIKAPSTIIPNGVTLEEIDPLPPRGEFLAGRPELRGKRFILFLARLHYKKGLDYLADSFALMAAKYPDLDLVVAGPDGGAREDFSNRMAAGGLSGRAHLVGPIYNREKLAALVDCECFVLPSRQEGFSIAVLEAMAARTPVVVSEACHFPEVATAGAGEVVPLNAQAVAAAMEKIITDPNRRRFGDAGRALVESKYTWDRVAEQTIGVYRKILSR